MTLLRRIILPAIASLGLLGAPAQAQSGLAGPYLAGRQASGNNDYNAAATYYAKALRRDPDSPLLLKSLLFAYAGLGEIEKAAPVAERMREAGVESRIATMVLIAEDVARGAYDAVLDDIDSGAAVNPLVGGLARGWAQFGAGDTAAALDAFGRVGEEQSPAVYGFYHKALALAASGDFEAAQEILGGDKAGPLAQTQRAIRARLQILSQLGRTDAALALIEDVSSGEPDPGLAALRDRLEAGETLDFDVVRNARDGAAELFYSVAGAMTGEAENSYTLIYGQLATFLRPRHADALLLSASLLQAQGRLDAAVETYGRVPRDDPRFFAAELGRARVLRQTDKPEAAIEVLRQLAAQAPDFPRVHVRLGDALRAEERYEAAVKAYDAAVALIGEPRKADWQVYYRRGIAEERGDDWDAAEADFRKALELSPDQPRVLNYLGYSLVEEREHLQEALGMIKRAIAARPQDGYITDSLGWALYRLGRYAKAVPKMERAVELTPTDPIVNDHLGDVYWAVGREREARFQWRRAQSFDPEPERAERIRRKLDVGLDKVLAEEGADPISVAHEG